MTEQHPGGTPDDFDAFHRPQPEPGLDQTMVFATVPSMEPELDPEPQSDPSRPGLKQRLTGLGRTRLAVAAVVAAAVIGGGAWAATAAASSTAPSNGGPVAAGAPTTGAPAPAKGKKAAKPGKNARAMKLAITQLGTDTFTATDAKGAYITVTYGATTKFGTKQRPLSSAQLTVGMTVAVMGERTGDALTATSIAEPAKGKNAKPSAPAAPSDSATSTDSATTES